MHQQWSGYLKKNGKTAEYTVTFLMMAVVFVSATISFCILKKNAVKFLESAFITYPIGFVMLKKRVDIIVK